MQIHAHCSLSVNIVHTTSAFETLEMQIHTLFRTFSLIYLVIYLIVIYLSYSDTLNFGLF